MPITTPLSTVYIGAVSATGTFPLYRIIDYPQRVRDVAILVDTSIDTVTWKFELVVIDVNGVTIYVSPKIDLAADGMKAYVWRTLVQEVGTARDRTVALRVTKTGSPAALSGLSVSFGVQVRE